MESQPEIALAPYQIPYRTKKRFDSICGKIETDADFIKWSNEVDIIVPVSVTIHRLVYIIIIWFSIDRMYILSYSTTDLYLNSQLSTPYRKSPVQRLNWRC